MITLSELIRLCPQIKDDGFRYSYQPIKWGVFPQWIPYKIAAEQWDFKKIQVLKVERKWYGYEDGSECWVLTLKQKA